MPKGNVLILGGPEAPEISGPRRAPQREPSEKKLAPGESISDYLAHGRPTSRIGWILRDLWGTPNVPPKPKGEKPKVHSHKVSSPKRYHYAGKHNYSESEVEAALRNRKNYSQSELEHVLRRKG